MVKPDKMKLREICNIRDLLNFTQEIAQ